VDTGGAGIRALEEASLALFGDSGPALDLAGSTDLGIVATLHSHFGIEPDGPRLEAFFEVYHHRLRWNLAHGNFPGRVIDGVPEVLDFLATRSGVALGLLTGNTAAGSAAKMRHFRLDQYFPIGAFGSDHADRNRLGPIALKRAAAHFGRNFTPAETWIIGDTPKDIACAQALGARCLAVATGRFSVESLQAHGADAVVASLDQALTWL
jgi:phosphoglycolate phosphatase-like HAD superfamily hydrolase